MNLPTRCAERHPNASSHPTAHPNNDKIRLSVNNGHSTQMEQEIPGVSLALLQERMPILFSKRMG
jgi:hypothetical protein